MVAHYNSSYPGKQLNPCSWYANYLALHGLRKVLNLHHGYSMCQSQEVGMNSLEHPLRIHTRNVISSFPPL